MVNTDKKIFYRAALKLLQVSYDHNVPQKVHGV